MSDEHRERPKDAGETVREGVRSITGILGALKEAIEETFSDFRPDGEGGADSPAAEAARSTFQRAQETVEEVRDRFDFVTRREFDALRAAVDELRARLDALDGTPPGAEPAATAAAADEAAGPSGANPDARRRSNFRFEVE